MCLDTFVNPFFCDATKAKGTPPPHVSDQYLQPGVLPSETTSQPPRFCLFPDIEEATEHPY